jgi:Flp pilus assembly protein TadG
MTMKVLLHQSSGAAAIEFAIVLPLLLSLLFGVLAYGYYAIVSMAVATAAAEGARASVAGMSDAERASLAEAAAVASVNNTGGFLVWDTSCSDCFSSGSPATGYYQVTVQYHLGSWLVLPYIPAPNLTVSSTVVAAYGGY